MELRTHEKKWLCPECGSHKEPNDDGMCQDCDIAWPTIQMKYNCPDCGCEVVHDLMLHPPQEEIPYACSYEGCDYHLEIQLYRAERKPVEAKAE